MFCGTRRLGAYLRPADRDPAHHTAAILKVLAQRLRQVWPQVRISIRGDGGFCRWRLMRWCDHNDIRYILGPARNAVLEREIASLLDPVERDRQVDGRTHREFQTFASAAQTWDRPRRVLAKVEYWASNKANPRFVVTNRPGDPQGLYEDADCERGEMANRIKDRPLGLFADRTRGHRFLANQFRVLRAACAHVLVEHIRRTALVGTDLAHAQVGTIRARLFQVGALVTRSVRRIVARMASGYSWAEVSERVVRCLMPPRIAAAPA